MASNNDPKTAVTGTRIESSGTLGDASAVESVDSPAVALVLAPSTSVTETATCLELLTVTDPGETDVLCVDFTRSPTDRLQHWQTHVGTRPANLQIVSAGMKTSSAAESSNQDLESRINCVVAPLTSPGNLTQLGVQITECLDRWNDTGNQLLVCFHSLSSFLHYVDSPAAFKFLNTLKPHLIESDALAHVHMEPNAHDEQTINQLMPLFDTVIDATNPNDRTSDD